MNAVLFDIDGTLLSSHGVGRHAFEKALQELVGMDIDMSKIDWFGRTDYDICATALETAGYQGNIPEIIPHIFGLYISYFDDFVLSDKNLIEPIPYAGELLMALHDCCPGLLTGNVMEAAFKKLKKVGFDSYFPYGIGGFGSDARDRNTLFYPALERMKKYYNTPHFERVILIGDSPRDIECAKINGALSLAVATGNMNYKTLAAYGPDYIFDNFKDRDKIIELLTRTL